MALRIEDYAMIGDCEAAALVGRDGSIDWLCLPRFDSGACFAALLGKPDNGRWLLAPRGQVRKTTRRYRPDTLVLETTFETDEGAVALVDCMSVREDAPSLVRLVEGKRGKVPMQLELIVRFDYGSIVPWVLRRDHGIRAIAGPNALLIHSAAPLHGKGLTTTGDFTVAEGERKAFTLTWYSSHEKPPSEVEAEKAVRDTEHWWKQWAGRCSSRGPYHEAIKRSLITLRALIYGPTGGVVAAPTTSLPEKLGGVRNWDYRYCWLRDSTFTLYSLISAGYHEEATAWKKWLHRAVAGTPSEIQIMYGLAGERRLTEMELPWLSGYENSRPVRIGNAASGQFQLDVYGEMLDTMYQCQRAGIPTSKDEWNIELALLGFLDEGWKKPDEGIWEVRGPRRNFTQSKVMAWVAFDRAVKAVENYGLEGPVEKWRHTRDAIHAQVCEEGFNEKLNSFVQFYGSDRLDASLLMLPMVGFLPPEDPRIKGTVAAIERDLMKDGFLLRYQDTGKVDGLPPGEGAFLPCTFWLADNYLLQGRREEAKALFERLLGLCNDVGLISEEYDPQAKRLVGNFPQAFTHVALVNTALNLSHEAGPVQHRSQS